MMPNELKALTSNPGNVSLHIPNTPKHTSILGFVLAFFKGIKHILSPTSKPSFTKKENLDACMTKIKHAVLCRIYSVREEARTYAERELIFHTKSFCSLLSRQIGRGLKETNAAILNSYEKLLARMKQRDLFGNSDLGTSLLPEDTSVQPIIQQFGDFAEKKLLDTAFLELKPIYENAKKRITLITETEKQAHIIANTLRTITPNKKIDKKEIAQQLLALIVETYMDEFEQAYKDAFIPPEQILENRIAQLLSSRKANIQALEKEIDQLNCNIESINNQMYACTDDEKMISLGELSIDLTNTLLQLERKLKDEMLFLDYRRDHLKRRLPREIVEELLVQRQLNATIIYMDEAFKEVHGEKASSMMTTIAKEMPKKIIPSEQEIKIVALDYESESQKEERLKQVSSPSSFDPEDTGSLLVYKDPTPKKTLEILLEDF